MASNVGSSMYAISMLQQLKNYPQKQLESQMKWTASKLIEQYHSSTDEPMRTAIVDSLETLYNTASGPLRLALEPIIKQSPISEPARLGRMFEAGNKRPQVTADPETQSDIYGRQMLAVGLYENRKLSFSGQPLKPNVVLFRSGDKDMVSTFTSEGLPFTRSYDDAMLKPIGDKYGQTPEEINARGGDVITSKIIVTGEYGDAERQHIKIHSGFNVHTGLKFERKIPTGVMAPLAGAGGVGIGGKPRPVPESMQNDFIAFRQGNDDNPRVAVVQDKLGEWADTYRHLGKEKATAAVRKELSAFLASHYRRGGANWNFIVKDPGHVAGLQIPTAIGEIFNWWSAGKMEIIAVPGQRMLWPVGDQTLEFYVDKDKTYDQVYSRDGVPMKMSYEEFMAHLQRMIPAGEVKGVSPKAVVPQAAPTPARVPGEAPVQYKGARVPSIWQRPPTHPGIPTPSLEKTRGPLLGVPSPGRAEAFGEAERRLRGED